MYRLILVINIHTINKNKTEVIFIEKKSAKKKSTGLFLLTTKDTAEKEKEENREQRLSLTLFKKFSRL